MIPKNTKIYVAGHRGLVGSAIWRTLESKGFQNLVGRTHGELDLTRQADVERFFQIEKPEMVVLAAARVGGIQANNSYRAEFLYQNLAIQSSVIHAAHVHQVRKLLFLGSNCIYPKHADQPMVESSLLTGTLEPTNEPYSIAKIAGLKMCESYQRQYGDAFIAVMPASLYGPDDNFDLFASHMVPATVRKFHLAKLLSGGDQGAIQKDLGVSDWAKAQEILGKFGITAQSITIWGSGTPRREFMHVDDMADGCAFLLLQDHPDLFHADPSMQFVNLGTGVDHSILEIATLVRDIVGFKGEILLDRNKPDGMMRKLLSNERMTKLGWRPRIALEAGLRTLYQEYLAGRGRRGNPA